MYHKVYNINFVIYNKYYGYSRTYCSTTDLVSCLGVTDG